MRRTDERQCSAGRSMDVHQNQSSQETIRLSFGVNVLTRFTCSVLRSGFKPRYGP